MKALIRHPPARAHANRHPLNLSLWMLQEEGCAALLSLTAKSSSARIRVGAGGGVRRAHLLLFFITLQS